MEQRRRGRGGNMSIHVLHIAEITHKNKHGEVLWIGKNIDNMLHDQGEQSILSAYFAKGYSGFGASPNNLYLGLCAGSAPTEASTLSSLSGEPSGSGYSRKALSTTGTGVSGQDFVLDQPGAYYRAGSKVVTFEASGGAWAPVTRLFLSTAASGTSGLLICTLSLSTTRTLQDGDSLNTSIFIGLSE